jgi:hypothetical protein
MLNFPPSSTLTFPTLFSQVHKIRPEFLFDLGRKELDFLKNNSVRLIEENGDPPYLTLQKTLREQRREQAYFSQNEALLTSLSLPVTVQIVLQEEDINTVSALLTLNNVLDTINLALIERRLAHHDFGVTMRFNFSHLHLTRLPEAFIKFMPAGVQSLSLEQNMLTTLPFSLGHLSQLHSLNLSNNQLFQLSPRFDQLRNLTQLDLRNNALQVYPQVLANLPLQYLFLHHNPCQRRARSKTLTMTSSQSSSPPSCEKSSLPGTISDICLSDSIDLAAPKPLIFNKPIENKPQADVGQKKKASSACIIL